MNNLKHFTLTVLVALVSCISAYAYDVEIGGIYYDLRESGHYETDSETGMSIYVKDYHAYVTDDNNYVDVDPDPTNTRLELQGGHYSGDIVIPSSIVYNEITYQVVGVYSYAFYKCTELESVVLPNTVTSIGFFSFGFCSSLTSITLPESLIIIDRDAFYYCSSLTSITLPESLTSIGSEAFCDCSSLTRVTLPKSLTSIGGYAFSGCSSLEEIELPEGLQYIATHLFINCSSLKKVNIPSSIISFRSNAFFGCNSLNSITIPKNSSISFENNAFNGYYGFVYNLSDMEIDSYSQVFTDKAEMDSYVFGKKDNQWYFTEYIGKSTDLVLPDNVNGEAYELYSNNKLSKDLTSIHLVSCIKSIPERYFKDFKNISEINLENVETIGSSAFNGCTGLTELTLEKNLSSIGVGAFAGCYNLQTLNYNVVHLENQRADNYVWYYDENGYSKATYYPLEFKSISTLNIGDEVEYIPNNMVRENKNLTTVNLADGIKAQTIGERTFYDCSNLQSINLYEEPKEIVSEEEEENNGEEEGNEQTKEVLMTEGVCIKNIGSSAFYGCTGLKEINLEKVETIGSSAFYGCTGLTELTLEKNLTSIGVGAFAGCYNLQTLNYNVVHFENHRADDYVVYYDENRNWNQTYYPLEFKSISTMNIGDEVEYIPNNVFQYNNNLTTVEIPNSVKTIGNYAFYDCQNVSSLTLGNSISNIGSNSFSFDAPLENLTVVNDYGLSYMLAKEYYDRTDYCYKRVIKKLVIAEDFADEQITGNFTSQNNLETIESNTVEPLAFALANPFTESQYSSIAVKVPEESEEKYKTAPVWKLFYVTSADCLLKLYNGSSEMQLIPQNGTERPEEATAVNAVMLIDEQLETDNGLLTMGNVVYRNKQNNWVAGEINLSDAKPFYNPVDVEAQTVNYVRNFTSTNLQALYLPYAMSYDDWKDKAKVSYINDVHQFDDDDDGEIDRTVLEFISVKSGELAPNIPYLIKPLEKGETTFTSSNKTLKATLYDGYIDCSSTRMLYTLKGTYQMRDDIYANGYYAMSGGTFKVADNAGVKLSPFRIFLSITNRYANGAVPRAKKITIMVDGVEEETTDIDEIMMSDAKPMEIYNLQGVRVDEGYKGIVIRNGRKVLMK